MQKVKTNCVLDQDHDHTHFPKTSLISKSLSDSHSLNFCGILVTFNFLKCFDFHSFSKLQQQNNTEGSTLPTVIVGGGGQFPKFRFFTTHFNLLWPPNLRNLKDDFRSFAKIALILSNSCRFCVNTNFFVGLFHPHQFIMTPQFMIFQKISNPFQLFSPPPLLL